MITAVLVRTETGDHGTFGTISIPDVGYEAFTAEPPWRDNRNRVSCIPAGEYNVDLRLSPKYGMVYHVKNVEGRSLILHHWGNMAGDTEKGLKSNTMGCILHGQKIGMLSDQRAIFNSRVKITEFHSKMNNQPFKLIIQWLS
jgi:hypothetical protein